MTLEQSIESIRFELNREAARIDDLGKNIQQTKQGIAQLEAKGQKIVALLEYKRMRLELAYGHKALADIKLKLLALRKQYWTLCHTPKSPQIVQRPKLQLVQPMQNV
jgi:hypothetical protein